jgi:hypothetical protein
MDLLVLNEPINYLNPNIRPSPQYFDDYYFDDYYFDDLTSSSDILSTEEYILPLRPTVYPTTNRFNFLDTYQGYSPPVNQMSKGALNFQLIEEEIIKMSRNRPQTSNMDNLMSSFSHVKLSSNGHHIQEEHINMASSNNAAQRRPSFKRHPTVPFGLSQGNLQA